MDSKGQPYPAHAPGFIPVPNQPPPQQHPTGYPHPPPQQSYAHPPPPPPYDANANMLPPGGGAGHHHPQATYVHTIVTAPQVGPDPASITCPSCQKHIVTRLDYETSTKTHIFAGLLCLFMPFSGFLVWTWVIDQVLFPAIGVVEVRWFPPKGKL